MIEKIAARGASVDDLWDETASILTDVPALGEALRTQKARELEAREKSHAARLACTSQYYMVRLLAPEPIITSAKKIYNAVPEENLDDLFIEFESKVRSDLGTQAPQPANLAGAGQQH
jgi:hypothetical protein